MKRIILLIAATSLLLSCKQENTFPKKTEWQEVAIGANVLPLSLRIPENEDVNVHARWNETFGRLELIGENNNEIFIRESLMTCADKKNELAADIFDVSYIEESDTMLVYKTSVPGGDEYYWNVFASIQADTSHYIIEQNPLIAYDQKAITQMATIIKRIKAN